MTAVGAIESAGLRTETAAQRRSAEVAVSFERLLLGELTKAIADPELVSGGGETSGATASLLGQLPEVLADALSAGGGIGLASALQPALEGPAA